MREMVPTLSDFSTQTKGYKRRQCIMTPERFWSDLSMWNRYGLAAVGATVIAALAALALM